MRKLSFGAVAALLLATAWTSGVSAQDTNTVTEAELNRHGFAMPPANVMLVVISHTGSQFDVTCALHDSGAGLQQDLGTLKNGETKAFGVNVQQLTGQFWAQCNESEGRRFSSNNIHSVGHTVVHFSTGSKFVITQRIVP